MNSLFRKVLAVAVVLAAVVVCGCGGSSSGSGGSSSGPGADSQAVDTQLKDDNNWQVIQTADK
jgi:ABC-type phosphate transport system substrate-binding protein